MSTNGTKRKAAEAVTVEAARKAQVENIVEQVNERLCTGTRRFVIPLLVVDAVAEVMSKKWPRVEVGTRTPERYDEETKSYIDGTAQLLVSEEAAPAETAVRPSTN